MADISHSESPTGVTQIHALENASQAKRLDFGPNSPIWILGLVIAFGFLAGSFFRGINLPWVEEDNWYGAVYSQAAHNNLRAGILTSGGVPSTLYFGPLPIPKDAFYVHHPTLLPMLVTGSFAVFGESEWAARLVPVTCSLVSVLLLWTLARSIMSRRAAALTVAFFVTLPMELHYGDMVDFEPCLVMCMLAALVCLRRWDVTRQMKWAAGAALSCQFALWMDWPGYLFVLSIAAGFSLAWLLNWPLLPAMSRRQSMGWAALLVGLVGFSGVLFLLQIRHVNPDAWADLWNALKMRLGNHLVTNSTIATPDVAPFSWLDWSRAIFHGLRSDFLLPPWIFAAIGVFGIVRDEKASEALRWCGLAAAPMVIAGLLYVVILRNESFVHDFATFYLIGALALLAAAGFELCLQWGEQKFRWHKRGGAVASSLLALFLMLAVFGTRQAEAQRSQFLLLDGYTKEPPNLVPVLGRELRRIFPDGTSILCNFDPYGTTLNYYAQRTLVTNLMEPSDWKAVIAEAREPLGGIVWLGAPGAHSIVAALPPGEVEPHAVGPFSFALWKPKK